MKLWPTRFTQSNAPNLKEQKPSTMLSPTWISDELFRLGETEFVMSANLQDLHSLQNTPDRFLLGKQRFLVEEIVAMRDCEDIQRIIDVGIFKGGSVALYALLFAPKKLVGIEYMAEPVRELEDFVARNGLTQSVRNYYNTNQADDVTLRKIVKKEFKGEELDLVVDDASHRYVESRATFQTLFPMLRPGGIYILEDWGWAHWQGDTWQKSLAFPADSPSLTNLLIEMSMLCASRPDLVATVEVHPSLIKLRRGPARIKQGTLQLDSACLNRGKQFTPYM